MQAPVVINSTHWANHGLQAWWAALPGLTTGLTWYDLLGRYNWTFTNFQGSESRSNYIWSPSGGTYGGGLGTAIPRPGAFTQNFLGPFIYGATPTEWHGTTSLSIPTVCPNAGTIAFWVIPTVTWNSSATVTVLAQSSDASYANYFNMSAGSADGGWSLGWRSGGTEYRAFISFSSYTPYGSSWSQIALTWASGDKFRAYVNGQLMATGSTNVGSPPSIASNLTMGSDSVHSDQHFGQNCVDDLNIWNYQMSAAQIQSIYQQSLQGWAGRLDYLPPWWASLPVANAYSVTGAGGMLYGGYPIRTSAWIMPGIGGVADGGKVTAPTVAFGPSPAGGLVDGGDTAAPLAWDTFTGSSGTLLTAHASDDGGAWTEHPNHTGSATKLTGSGAVAPTAGFHGFFLHSPAPASADYTVSCDCTSVSGSSSYMGVGVRWSSGANTGYYAYADQGGSALYLYKYVTGTQTQLDTTSISWSTGQTKRMSLVVEGTSLRVYWDNVLKLGPTTDSSISSAGQGALYLQGTGISADNWMSTGGGVQARYFLSAAGGEALGGRAATPTAYVLPCTGGVFLGGYSGSVMAFGPSVSGGVKDGGLASPIAVYIVTASGGIAEGGVAVAVSGVLMMGGMTDSGQIASAIVAFHPAPSGGLQEGGYAPSIGVFSIQPSGGMGLGGTIIVAGLSYHVYGNDGAGGPIDYTTVLSTVFDFTWQSGTLTGPGVWNYGVRAYDGDHHLEELNVDAVVTVKLDADGNDITAIPDPPISLMGHAASGGAAILNWHYNLIDRDRAPTEFRVYQGTGSVSYSSPVTTVPYTGPRVYTVRITGLVDGTAYLFSIRAANWTGEEANTTTITIVGETSGPSAVINVSSSAVAS